MKNIVVIGLQWGDEGKGKIVDWLSKNADAVIRFQGGNNAGHTIIFNNKIYKLNSLPSSILYSNKLSIIGNGATIDPYAFIKEINTLKSINTEISNKNLIVSELCPIVTSIHREADAIFEEMRGNNVIGTTHKGIGPCYEDKVGRRAIRLCDLLDQESLYNKVSHMLSYHNIFRKAANKPVLSVSKIVQELVDIAPHITPFMRPVWRIVNNLIENNKTIIFEGAQGTLLDIDHGTYPYVTSSNTLASQVYAGCGIGISNKLYVLGLAKAYTTRVGNGPFFTEQNNTIGDIMFQKGNEIGTVSNRRRRCGWFDAVLTRQAIILSGVSSLAITKLDVLDHMDTIKICTKYQHNSTFYDYLPASPHIQKELKPVYIELPGWRSTTFSATSYNDLPTNAKLYIQKLEELLRVPIHIISTGPDRNHTITLNNFLIN
ncbi:adenylosuccinate synthase [Neoehrlichia mikurensis]|uniref:Adenylosuccinate synthetase n=1 Tax=Neoehrlichia mikurensis TaxID=89586 RepID=A0A9Q9F3M3_9RICK|nr:adenylosuccinate synthase [Neoehrlichia mikurensis]QXK91833.1 adenylosuccinate synthase [Neoehrlichia mikurensis]QXK93046.1 adenylosuccinate synthase [Neoehrlichia mikurensis]QXK93524.1 adenylosuccinate synthase [Neoehrlichia mikurensis]UTO55520.1 adenylosuccinate synthase [Neoehrlichia mikurensis]